MEQVQESCDVQVATLPLSGEILETRLAPPSAYLIMEIRHLTASKWDTTLSRQIAGFVKSTRRWNPML